MRRIAITAAAVATLAATLPSAATGADRWSLRGAGWGHGIGMSQYGAYGFSKHGADYRQILAHYYRDTAIGRRDGGTIRVLLEPNQSAIGFRTAGSAGREAARPEQALQGEAERLHRGPANSERPHREARRRHHHRSRARRA